MGSISNVKLSCKRLLNEFVRLATENTPNFVPQQQILLEINETGSSYDGCFVRTVRDSPEIECHLQKGPDYETESLGRDLFVSTWSSNTLSP